MKQVKITLSKAFISMITVLIAVTMLFSLTGCGSEDKLVGMYEGTAGSFLKLAKDGSCVYGEDDDTGAGKGTWYVEDDTLYVEVDIIDYELYASIDDEDGFLLEGDSSSWNDEYFSKVEK